MVRLCKMCKQMCDTGGHLKLVLALCRRISWICPFGKEQCGMVDGKTQKDMRDEMAAFECAMQNVEEDRRKWN